MISGNAAKILVNAFRRILQFIQATLWYYICFCLDGWKRLHHCTFHATDHFVVGLNVRWELVNGLGILSGASNALPPWTSVQVYICQLFTLPPSILWERWQCGWFSFDKRCSSVSGAEPLPGSSSSWSKLHLLLSADCPKIEWRNSFALRSSYEVARSWQTPVQDLAKLACTRMRNSWPVPEQQRGGYEYMYTLCLKTAHARTRFRVCKVLNPCTHIYTDENGVLGLRAKCIPSACCN